MVDRPSEVLLADADVLIDYIETDREILALCSAHFAPVHVMDTTLDEVAALSRAECSRLGLVVEPVERTLLDAASQERLALSIPDTVCLLSAATHQWTCVTNEKALRKRCEARGVRVRRGLNLMVELVQAGHLSAKHAERVARAIQKLNPGHVHDAVIAEFLTALAK